MPGSFLDTTIVIDMAGRDTAAKQRSEAFISAHRPAETPYYALRELLTGHIRIVCEAHNILLAAENLPEALAALNNRPPFEGRKKEARINALIGALQRIYSDNPAGSRNDLKREALQDLALKASTLWRNARHLPNVQLVQALACFNNGKVKFGDRGELRGPGNSFNCLASERCSAADYLYDNQAVLQSMIDALHSSKLSPKLARKRETTQRRKALQELKKKGPTDFDKGRCRALGDAYFAAMCPANSVVVTTNLVDHAPLCSALAKEARKP